MDGFARFDGRRRAGLFDEAGARRGVSSIIIEKDFWVCWALKHLFAHADAAAPTNLNPKATHEMALK